MGDLICWTEYQKTRKVHVTFGILLLKLGQSTSRQFSRTLGDSRVQREVDVASADTLRQGFRQGKGVLAADGQSPFYLKNSHIGTRTKLDHAPYRLCMPSQHSLRHDWCEYAIGGNNLVIGWSAAIAGGSWRW